MLWLIHLISQDYVVAVVVPDVEVASLWAKENLDGMDMAKLILDDRFTKEVMNQMNIVANEAGLKGFEKVKSIQLILTPFSSENGLLTPTLKLKRTSAKKQFSDIIDALYQL